MYCEKCRIVFDAPRCPRCGNRHVREAEAKDLCLLTEKEVLWSEMVEDAMRDADIPCLAKGKLGAGMTKILGTALETIRFYVPYGRLAEARAIVDALFSETEEEEVPEA